MIETILELIKTQTGLALTLCDYFTGIHALGEAHYFNVVLNERVSESTEFQTLQRFANTYSTIRVEPNGLHRVAIFFKP